MQMHLGRIGKMVHPGRRRLLSLKLGFFKNGFGLPSLAESQCRCIWAETARCFLLGGGAFFP